MSTSGTEAARRRAGRTAFVYLLLACLCALFGAVYERFSHGVYSYFMLYAFAFPLAGGAVPFAALSLSRSARLPPALARNLYHAGIAALTVGSLVRGVLDIYGTTNRLCRVYGVVGVLGVAAGIVGTCADRFAARRRA